MMPRCCDSGCRGRLRHGGGWRRRWLRMADARYILAVWVIFHAWILIPTLVFEALFGYPAWLHARIPHPVVWAGYAIGALDRRWNKPEYSFAKRRLLGCMAVLLVAGAGSVLGAGLEAGIAAVAAGASRGSIAAEVGTTPPAAAAVDGGPIVIPEDNPVGLPAPEP